MARINQKRNILAFMVFSAMILGVLDIHGQMSAEIESQNGTTFCEGEVNDFILIADVEGGEENYTYEWTNSWEEDTTYNYFTLVRPDTTGTVRLVVKDGNDEFPKFDTAYLEIEEIRVSVDFGFRPDSACANSTIQFDPEVTGGDPDYQYRWYFGDGQASWEQHADHEFTTNDCFGYSTFPVELMVTDDNGCSASVIHDVAVLNTPRLEFNDIASSTPFKHCHDPSVEPPDFDVKLQNSTHGNHPCIINYSIDWGDGSPPDLNVTNFPITHTYTSVGAFQLTVTAENSTGCDISWSTFVYNQSTPAVGLETPGNTTGCAPKDFSFRLTGLDRHTLGTTYTWYFHDGTDPVVWNDDSVAIKDAITHRYTRSHCEFGYPSFGVTVVANNGCTEGVNAFVDGVLIETSPAASITNSAEDGTICTDETLILQNGTPTAYSIDCDTTSAFYWDLGNGITLSEREPEVVWTDPGEYDVVLTANPSNNCPAGSDTFRVVVTAAPEAHVNIDDTSRCAPFTPVFDNNSTGESIGYLWKVSPSSGFSFVNGTDKNSREPDIRFDSAGYYEVTFYVYNICDQKDSLLFKLNVFDAPEGELMGVNNLCITDPVLHPEVDYDDNGTSLTGLLWDFDGGNPGTSDQADPGEITYNTSGDYQVSLTLTNQCGTVEIEEGLSVFDAPEIIVDSPQEICEVNNFIPQGAIINNVASFYWDTEGDGYFDYPTASNPTYYPGGWDKSDGSVLLSIVSYGFAPCSPLTEDILLYIQSEPEVFAGEDASVCEGSPYTLFDASAENYDTLQWSTSIGDGRFSNSRTLNPRYIPGAADLARGWVELTLTATAIYPCTRNVSDAIIITYDRKPEIDAGPDKEICLDGTIPVSATGTDYSSVDWYVINGEGTFDEPNEESTFFTLSSGYSEDTVTILIEANGAYGCPNDIDTLVLFVIQPPDAKAGPDATICETQTFQPDAADVAEASSYFWRVSGDGDLDAYDVLDPVFTPGPQNITDGEAVLTLVAEGNGPCASDSDDLIVTILHLPEADAGEDMYVCMDHPVPLNGSHLYGSTWEWTSLGTNPGLFDDPAGLRTSYHPSEEDYLNGSVRLMLTVAPVSPCGEPATDIVEITFVDPPVVNAGPDTVICASEFFSPDQASVLNSDRNYWETTGLGTFQNGTTLNPTYLHAAQDVTEDSILLMLVSSSPTCPDERDSLVLKITPYPVVEAGDHINICEDQVAVMTDARAEHFSSFSWHSAGDGDFDGENSIAPVYTPGQADIAAGVVKIFLEVDGQYPCNVTVKDSLYITIKEIPVAYAGPDTVICSSTFTPDSAYVINDAVIHWESTGTGAFINENTLHPTYIPTMEDISEGAVDLILFATNTPCEPVTDTMHLDLIPYPFAEAGENTVICEDKVLALSDAVAENYDSLVWTNPGGDGSFDDIHAERPLYVPGAQDIQNGSVKLMLTVYGHHPCNQPGKDSIILTIRKLPFVSAGRDSIIAEGQQFTVVDASEAYTAGILWETTGDGVLLNATDVRPTYIPGPEDLASGWVKLVINGTPDAPCTEEVTDTMLLYITPIPDISAGEDMVICEGSDVRITTASAEEVSRILWVTEGNGQLLDAQTLTPTYIPDAQDIINREVVLSLHAWGEYPLDEMEIVDHMVVTIYHNAIVDMTSLDTACENQWYEITDVTYLDVNEVSWSSSGTGGYTQTSTRYPSYIFSQMDRDEDTLYLSVEVTSFAPCTAKDQDTMMIRLFHEPEASFMIDDQEGCGPHTTLLSNTSTGEELEFRWNFGNDLAETTVQHPGSITFQQGKIADTTYTITLEASNRCNNSLASGQVIVKPIPIPSFGMDVAWGCSPKEIQFFNVTTGLADTYTWEWGDGTASSVEEQPGSHVFIAGENDTTYYIKLVAENECGVDSLQKSVMIFPNKVTAFFETDTTLGCAPLEVSFMNYSRGVLGDEPFLNWSWNFGDGKITDTLHPVHVFREPGTYNVELVVSDTCSVDSYSTQIVVMGAPSVRFDTDQDVYCEHDTVFFRPLEMPLEDIAAVTWDFGDGSMGGDFHASHVYEQFGTYNVTLSAKDIVNGCTSSTSTAITVNESPVAAFTIPDNDACEPLDITFANETVGADYYSWDFGNGNGSIDEHGKQVFADSGVYTIKLFVSDMEGCTDQEEKTLRVHPKPLASFEPSSLQTCFPPIDVAFTNLSEGADDYRWNFGNGVSLRSTDPSTTFEDYGDYPVRLIVNNMYHCSDTSDMVYHVYHNPEAAFTVDSTIGCDPFSVPFINHSQYGVDYYWQFGDQGFSREKDPVFTFEGAGVSNVSLLVIGNGGCRDSVSMDGYITTNPSPFASFDYTRINEIDTVQFHNYSSGALSYLWDFGDGDLSEESDPWHRYLNYGMYNVSLTAVNEYNCTHTVYDSINFKLFKGLFVPNAFSPGTRIEDVQEFRAVGIGLIKYHLLVYDTWGNLLWETTRLDRGAPAESWDGTFRGQPLEPDVYVWYLKEAVFKDGSSYDGERYGTITLIR